MSCSKLSTTEIPISVRLKIPKENLLNVREQEKWVFKSEDLNIEELSGVKYRVGICSFFSTSDENFSGQCIFVYLVIIMENDLKMNVDYEVSVPSANYIGKKKELQIGEKHVYKTYIGQADELFDPAKNFIVNDNLIITMEAILSVQKEEFCDAGSDLKASKCCECKLGSNIWEHDDKDFAFIVEENEIKIHKFVVGAKSSVFHRMFECGMKESKEGKVTIIDFSFDTVTIALKFCYGIEEQKKRTRENAIELLRFAEKYDINDLKAVMETFLSSQISPTNVCKIANASILGNSIKLHEECFEYLFECNQKKISVSDLDLLNDDFALMLLKASFALFPMLCEREEHPETEEEEEVEAPQIRKPFVKKVAGIVTLMLIACYIFVALLITSTSIQELWRSINPIFYRTLFTLNETVMLSSSYTFAVFPTYLQRSPYKWISAVTVIAGFMIAIYISHFTVTSVIFAFILTLLVTAFLIIYASFTRMDFTNFRLFIFGVSALLCGYALFSSRFALIPWFPQIYYFLCALVTMVAFVMNVQHILGTFEFIVDEDEHYHTAITIFQIIFQMFIFILGVFGGSGGVENFIPYVCVGLGPTIFFH